MRPRLISISDHGTLENSHFPVCIAENTAETGSVNSKAYSVNTMSVADVFSYAFSETSLTCGECWANYAHWFQ